MASSVSTINNYSNIQPFDFGNMEFLTASVLAKQGEVDTNKKELQDAYDTMAYKVYNSLSRDSDKEYFKEKLDAVFTQVNGFIGTGDLTNPAFVDNITNQIGSLVKDKRVMNAVSSSTVRRLEDEENEYQRVNNPDKYSDINRQVMSKGWQKYLNSEDPNATYRGGGGYVEYVDTNQAFTSKEFYDYLDNSGVRAKYVRREDGTGYFASINEYEEIDPQKLQQIVQSYGGEKLNRQLQINAEYAYGDSSNKLVVDSVAEMFTSKVNKQLDTTQSQIDAIDKLINSSKISQAQKEQLINERNGLNDALNSYSELSFDKVYNEDGTINEGKYKNLYTNMYTNGYFEDKFNLIYQKPRLLKTEIDDVQYKSAQFAETKRMNSLAFQKEAREARQDQWEMSGKPLLNPDGSYATDDEGNLRYLDPNAQKAFATPTSNSSQTATNINVGQGSPITKEEAPTISIKNDWNKDYRNSVDTIVKTSGGSWTEATTTELENYLMTNTPTIGKNITLPSGKVVKVNQENIIAMDNLRTMVAGDNGAVRQLRNTLDSYQKGYQTELLYKAKQNINTIPNNYLGDQYFVETGQRDSQGNKVYELKKGTISGATEGNFKTLLKKSNSGKPLTEAEKKTVELYSVLSMVNNPEAGLSDFEKNQAFRQYQSKNSPSTNITIGKYSDFKSPVSNYKGVNIDPAVASGLAVSRSIQQRNNNVAFTPMSKQAYKTTVESIAEGTRALAHRDNIIIAPPSPTATKEEKASQQLAYDNAKREAGLPSDYKGNIRLTREFSGARPTGTFAIEIEQVIPASSGKPKTTNIVKWNRDGDESKGVMKLDLERVRTFIPTIADASLTSYTTSLGSNAARLDFNSRDNFLSPYAVNAQNAKTQTDLKKNQDMYAGNFRNYYSDDMKQVLDVLQNEIRAKRGESFNLYEELSKTDDDFRIPSASVVPDGGSYKVIDSYSNRVVRDLMTPTLYNNDVLNLYNTQKEASKIAFATRIRDKYTQ